MEAVGDWIEGSLYQSKYFSSTLEIVSWMFGWAILIGLVLLSLVIFRWLIQVYTAWHSHLVCLEITPPLRVEKSLEASQQFFAFLHSLRDSRGLLARVFGIEPRFSFEVVSRRSSGVGFRLAVDQKYVAAAERAVYSFIPEAKIKMIARSSRLSRTVSDIGGFGGSSDPADPDNPADVSPTLPYSRIVDFKQSSHFILPIYLPSRMMEADPMSYVLGAMANLDKNESVHVQVVASPLQRRQIKTLAHRLRNNEDVLSDASFLGSSRGQSLGYFGLFGIPRLLASLLGTLLGGVVGLFNEVFTSSAYGYKEYYETRDKDLMAEQPVLRGDKPARTLSQFESELMDTINTKLAEPIFSVSLRVRVDGSSIGNVRDTSRRMRASFSNFKVPLYQALQPRRRSRIQLRVLDMLKATLFDRRLLSLRGSGSMTLSSSELASLYHFPSSLNSRTDNLVESLSKTLPAPISMKGGDKSIDYLIGENMHHGVKTPIGLSSLERERHMYILGGTGNGKTTMMLYGIMQDIESGKGLAVIDPHGDLAEDILARIPESRLGDVIYLNPDDLSFPIGLNLLELRPGLEGDDLVREKDQVTEMVLSVLRKLFSESDMGGHRIEYILRNAVQTALGLDDPTLFTVYELLNNPPFRYRALAGLDDPHLELFWRQEFGKAGDMQRVKMAAGITSKIGRFLFSGSAKRIIGQKKSTIDFDSLIDEGRILVCNFSKGLLGEDTSTLFGTMVLARLQLASLRRARLPANSRKDFYLYVDEFQNFATMSFVQMLSEARKYRLYLVIAEQSTTQQGDKRLVEVLLANVGTVVAFRSGSPADERMILPLFTSFIGQGEIANLPTFHFYARLAGINPEEPVSGQTILPEGVSSLAVKERVIARSRQEYTGEVIDNVLSSPPPVEVLPGTGRRGSTLRGVEVSAVDSIEVDSASSSGGGGKVVVDEGSIGVVDKPSELVGKKFGIPG